MQQQATLDEKSMLEDMLYTHKDMMNIYSTLLAETSDPNLRGKVQDLFLSIAVDQYKIYDLMSQKGYYQTKMATPDEVAQTKQSAQQMQSKLN